MPLDFDELKSTAQQAKDEAEKIKSRASAIKLGAGDLGQEVTGHLSTIDELEDDMFDLEGDVALYLTEISDYESTIGEKNDYITQLEQEVQDLGGSIPLDESVDWIDTGEDNSLVEDPTLFAYDSGTSELSTSSTLDNIHSHLKDPTTGVTQIEGTMTLSDLAGGIGLTFQSNYNGSDAYYRIRRFDSSGFRSFHVSAHGASITWSGTTDSGFSPAAGVATRYKIQIDVADPGGVRIFAKFWTDGQSEPADWQIDCTDPASTRTAGRVGVWCMAAGSKTWSMPTISTGAIDSGGEGDPGDDTSDPIPPAGTVTTVTVRNISWEVDDGAGNAVDVKFSAVGDPVVRAGSRLVSVTPSPTGTRHGSALNPTQGFCPGYDSRIPENRADRQLSYPYTLQAGDCVIATQSHADGYGSTKDITGRDVDESRAKLKQAAVVCAVSDAEFDAATNEGFLRLGHSGGTTLLNVPDTATLDLALADRGYALPAATGQFEHAGASASPADACAKYAALFQRPWLLHVHDWTARASHPTDNQPNYHREVYSCVSDAALLLQSDAPRADKELLFFGMLQRGLDSFRATNVDDPYDGKNGGDSSYCKLLTMMATTWFSPAGTVKGGRTDYQTYYLVNRGSSLVDPLWESSGGTDGVDPDFTWTGNAVGWRKKAWLNDANEHEQLHPERTAELDALHKGGATKHESYRRAAPRSWPGLLVAALGWGITWGHPEFVDYCVRWMTEPDEENHALWVSVGMPDFAAGGQSCITAWQKSAWDAYVTANGLPQ